MHRRAMRKGCYQLLLTTAALMRYAAFLPSTPSSFLALFCYDVGEGRSGLYSIVMYVGLLDLHIPLTVRWANSFSLTGDLI